MADLATFAVVAATVVVANKLLGKRKREEAPLLMVDKDNELLPPIDVKAGFVVDAWQRATYALVMHDPPTQFYEPKEWDHTAVILCRTTNDEGEEILFLPVCTLHEGESYVQAGARAVMTQLGIDVSQPENSLHHLFTFPTEKNHRWSDFMECVYRGTLEDLHDRGISPESIVRMSLGELKNMVIAQQEQDTESENPESMHCIDPMFTSDSYYALRLFLQRQGDLRAKRRLLKGYSSSDLEHYRLRRNSKVVFLDDQDNTRQEALDFTLKTDDGQAPDHLFEADLILLGVSRSGKTPLSLVLSQTMGLKVANVPLVVDVPPPAQLFKVNPRRVFCLTVDENQLKTFRKSRLRREINKQTQKAHKNSYADLSYVRKDIEHAQRMAYDHGFTEINVSGRAIEETASLIASKLRERFPNTEILGAKA